MVEGDNVGKERVGRGEIIVNARGALTNNTNSQTRTCMFEIRSHDYHMIARCHVIVT